MSDTIRTSKVFNCKISVKITYDGIKALQEAFDSLKVDSPKIWMEGDGYTIMSDTDPLEIIGEK